MFENSIKITKIICDECKKHFPSDNKRVVRCKDCTDKKLQESVGSF